MKRLATLLCIAIMGCATIDVGPDPRDEFSERNVGKTLATYVDGLGTQVVHLADDGQLYVYSGASPSVQKGDWKFDILATGAATTYQGAGGINVPVEELETAWGVCFRYKDAAGNIVRRPAGGDWNCALLTDYEPLITERMNGDVFGLARGQTPGEMPQGARVTLAQLQRL